MKEVAYKTYKFLLTEGTMAKSQIPSTVQKSTTFKGLLEGEILLTSKVGRGLKISVNKEAAFRAFFATSFPEDIETFNKSTNIRKYRNSKATKVENAAIFFCRGFQKISINSEMVDMDDFTQKFGLFAIANPMITCDKICFVENLETFLNVEKLLGKTYLYLHKYGRIGTESLRIFQVKEVLVFVDYDFNGLDEFLRIKAVFPQATLYVPSNYEALFLKYAKSLKDNKAKMSIRVKNATLETVVKIREQVAQTNKFLEQEVLIYD